MTSVPLRGLNDQTGGQLGNVDWDGIDREPKRKRGMEAGAPRHEAGIHWMIWAVRYSAIAQWNH